MRTQLTRPGNREATPAGVFSLVRVGRGAPTTRGVRGKVHVKRMYAILAVLVGLTAGLLAAPPAQAAPEQPAAQVAASYDNCPQGWICLYQSANGGGPMFTISGGLSRLCFNLAPSGWNDRADSIANKTGRTLDLWENAGCGVGGGWHIVVAPHSNLGYFGLDKQDELSSIYIR